jgi:uncharacterized protein YjiS (DUF1127 family)
MTTTATEKPNPNPEFNWQPFPETGLMVHQLLDDFCETCEFASALRERMLAETGTRLVDWVDHFAVNRDTSLNGTPFREKLKDFGYESSAEESKAEVFVHPGGIFPPIRLLDANRRRVAIRVDDVVDFVTAHHLEGVHVEGEAYSGFRRAKIAVDADCEFWVCERQGNNRWEPHSSDPQVRLQTIRHLEHFRQRTRHWENEEQGFQYLRDLIKDSIDDLGVNLTCDLFFEAERRYWQSRNRAARVQKQRQDRLGLGWANHDHHTYRSSRKCFVSLVQVLELLGFECRERFYAGEEAGWGAQVMEQDDCGIVIFADVDLDPTEISGDFAHQGLEERGELGTVGLWCQLHGEAILQAGMHHLECTFDFDAARSQLEREGIESMAPFTDMDVLKQAFTAGELWTVQPSRVHAAVAKGLLNEQQAKRFVQQGAIGSHLEILERNEGFKGFNQKGVSSIIAKTDPRSIG